jgi:glycerol-3-phosphate O-acyltransferase
MRVVGLEGIKRFRQEHASCALTFKPNHLSEADFILLGILFRENGLRVVTEGGANLFLEDVDIFRDLLPRFAAGRISNELRPRPLSVAKYLSTRGAFKVYREPVTVKLADGNELKLGSKDILTLSRAYRCHLVEQGEMYVTFPGFSTIRSGPFDMLKKSEMKTGRSYTGKIDGFHHLPFQMDIEASLFTGVEVYVVDVNIAYEEVLEDQNFVELTRLHDAGTSKKEIYLQDLSYIIREFMAASPKKHLCIKFGEPRKLDTAGLKEPFMNRKIKNAAHLYAGETYEKMLAMQPVFPANIYFSAFDEGFNRIALPVLREKIDQIRQRLRNMTWGREKRRVDLHYVMGFNDQVVSAEEIINRTFKNFNRSGRRVTDLDGDSFVVYNKNVARQYRNHTHHLLVEPRG